MCGGVGADAASTANHFPGYGPGRGDGAGKGPGSSWVHLEWRAGRARAGSRRRRGTIENGGLGAARLSEQFVGFWEVKFE